MSHEPAVIRNIIRFQEKAASSLRKIWAVPSDELGVEVAVLEAAVRSRRDRAVDLGRREAARERVEEGSRADEG